MTTTKQDLQKIKKAYRKKLSKILDTQIEEGKGFSEYLLTYLAFMRDVRILNTDLRNEDNIKEGAKPVDLAQQETEAIFNDLYNNTTSKAPEQVQSDELESPVFDEFTQGLIDAIDHYQNYVTLFSKLCALKAIGGLDDETIVNNPITINLLKESTEFFTSFWTFIESHTIQLEDWQNV